MNSEEKSQLNKEIKNLVDQRTDLTKEEKELKQKLNSVSKEKNKNLSKQANLEEHYLHNN